MIIIGVIGVDLWSIHLSHPEQVGGCRWTTVEYHKHHAFPIDSRPNCWKPHHLLWGWPCQLRCTRNVFRMGTGTKADQEELQCHHPELTENHWNYRTQWYNMPCLELGRFCSRCEVSSSLITLSSTCSSTSLSKLISWPCWLDQVCYGYGHIVMLHDVAICQTPSRNIVMHASGSRANLNNCRTYTKKESWRTM